MPADGDMLAHDMPAHGDMLAHDMLAHGDMLAPASDIPRRLG
jgi:hypothetical protein